MACVLEFCDDYDPLAGHGSFPHGSGDRPPGNRTLSTYAHSSDWGLRSGHAIQSGQFKAFALEIKCLKTIEFGPILFETGLQISFGLFQDFNGSFKLAHLC